MEWGELPFKIVRFEAGGQEVLVRAGNYLLCKAAFEKAVELNPKAQIELRQGARVIDKSKEV